MLTQQSVKDLLYSLPIQVTFAGFRGDTLTLAKNGWELSMRQEMDRYGEYNLQLAAKHGEQRHAMYLLSHPLILQMRYFMGDAGGVSFVKLAEYLRNVYFDIGYMNNHIRMLNIPVRGISAHDFKAIDAIPQMGRTEEFDLSSFKFFKVANENSKELIILPEKVPELLDMILQLQAKDQAEIRKRQESRENLKQYRSGELFAKPQHEVQAQIITLAV